MDPFLVIHASVQLCFSELFERVENMRAQKKGHATKRAHADPKTPQRLWQSVYILRHG